MSEDPDPELTPWLYVLMVVHMIAMFGIIYLLVKGFGELL